jgi:hypothetical protein
MKETGRTSAWSSCLAPVWPQLRRYAVQHVLLCRLLAVGLLTVWCHVTLSIVDCIRGFVAHFLRYFS